MLDLAGHRFPERVVREGVAGVELQLAPAHEPEAVGVVPRWTAKADPGEALTLRDQNSHITAGYHMNKKHWITLERR